uniref:Uncharacterized protein n=1 Tax=Setaria italica TaxID=4555 RepID=K3ZCY1_SETIT
MLTICLMKCSQGPSYTQSWFCNILIATTWLSLPDYTGKPTTARTSSLHSGRERTEGEGWRCTWAWTDGEGWRCTWAWTSGLTGRKAPSARP